MSSLPGFTDPDGFYEALLDAHAGLPAAESHALNARLVLLLASRIGDREVLQSCLDAARGTDATHQGTDP